ncbi:hypothetical protein R6Q57_015250 [Mikania cordata]
MEAESLSLDIISTLPDNIIESILSLMPIRDALRTSILSKRWQYCWQNMPKLEFTNDMVKGPNTYGCTHFRKCKAVNAIFHVLLLHKGPTTIKVDWSDRELEMFPEFDHIISCLPRLNNMKELILSFRNGYYMLPLSFFLLQGLECLHLKNCGFEPPSTFSGFRRLRSLLFMNVVVSSAMLQRLLSNCPLLNEISLNGYQKCQFIARENKFTFVDLFRCAPLIENLDISKYYMKYLCTGGMPHKLSTSPSHLKYLFLDVCLMEQDEISSIICMIRSSPLLVKIVFMMYDNDKPPVQRTPNNFLDLENYSDLKLDHLETLEIEMFSNLAIEMDFVKLIMAKSAVLKKVQLDLSDYVCVDEELKMLRDLVLHPLPRASPSAKLIIQRPKTCL